MVKKLNAQMKDITEVCGTCVYYNGDMNDESQFCDKRDCEVNRNNRCERWRLRNESKTVAVQSGEEKT